MTNRQQLKRPTATSLDRLGALLGTVGVESPPDAGQPVIDIAPPPDPRAALLPLPDTAQQVWELAALRMGLKVDDLRHVDGRRTRTPIVHDEIKIKQMFAVALHTAIGPTRRRRPDDDDDLGTASVTQNKIFDALGRWSPTYLDAHEKAKVSYDMEQKRGTPALRELRGQGLNFLSLVKALRGGCDGLYRTTPPEDGSDVELVDGALLDRYWEIVSADPAYRIGGGLLLADDPSPPHDRGDREVAAEWAYNVVNPGRVGLKVLDVLEAERLLFDVGAYREDFERIRKKLAEEGIAFDKAKAVAKVEFDVVKRTPKTDPDYDARRKVASGHYRPAKDRYKKALGDFQAAWPIIAELDRRELRNGFVMIKSRFFMGLNRRYYALDFWPDKIGKGELTDDLSVTGLTLTRNTVRRGRYFWAPSPIDQAKTVTGFPHSSLAALGVDAAPLVGVDVSASWLHTQAAFLMVDLEAWLETNSYKDDTTIVAQTKHAEPGDPFILPRGPDDPDLPKAVNNASMMDNYGGKRIAKGLRDDGFDLGTEKNVRMLLNDSRLKMHAVKETWPSACEMIAERAHPFAGIEFAAPLDRTPIRLNPVQRFRQSPIPHGTVTVDQAARLEHVKAKLRGLIVGPKKTHEEAVKVLHELIDSEKVREFWEDGRQYLPLRRSKKDKLKNRPGLPLEEWAGHKLSAPLAPRMPSAGNEGVSIYFALPMSDQDEHDDYRVWPEKLKSSLRPFLIHILDATYMSFVVLLFKKMGGGTIVSIYDAWFVAADDEAMLMEAILAAGQLWLRSLGPAYDLLVRYLTGTEYEKWAVDLRVRWEKRVEAGLWPKFRVGPAETGELIWEDEGVARSFGPQPLGFVRDLQYLLGEE